MDADVNGALNIYARAGLALVGPMRPEKLTASAVTAVTLDTFASKDMPGRQRDIQDCVDKILAKVDPAATAG
jgi:hypothetical protein